SPIVFFKEVKSELSKVVWPTRPEVIKLTAIVIVVSVVIGLYIGGLDMVMTKLTDLLIKK
ncbi:preprotein translocase subunit SecE, partial [Candidatus Microgenomates bacterium]|nr:preprotein translocase subunit SecE [Candidatus Microgenomates bacterium]